MHLSPAIFSLLFCSVLSPHWEGYVFAVFVLHCFWTSSCLNCEENASNDSGLGMYRLCDFVLYDLLGHVRHASGPSGAYAAA